MIIRRDESDLLLITQPDHAALAARLMEQWVCDGLPGSTRRSAVLHAVEQHDNGWREPDQSPIVDAKTGQLLDFVNSPTDIRRGVWPRGVERLTDTPYSAALVAQHAIHIYGRYRQDPSWQPFFDDMHARRSRHIARAGETEEQLLTDYFFVRVGDLMSLIFCNGWTEEERHGPYSMRLEGNRLRVLPDPFAGRQIRVEICARRLPSRAFRSADDARRAFDEAPAVMLTGVATAA